MYLAFKDFEIDKCYVVSGTNACIEELEDKLFDKYFNSDTQIETSSDLNIIENEFGAFKLLSVSAFCSKLDININHLKNVDVENLNDLNKHSDSRELENLLGESNIKEDLKLESMSIFGVVSDSYLNSQKANVPRRI